MVTPDKGPIQPTYTEAVDYWLREVRAAETRLADAMRAAGGYADTFATGAGGDAYRQYALTALREAERAIAEGQAAAHFALAYAQAADAGTYVGEVGTEQQRRADEAAARAEELAIDMQEQTADVVSLYHQLGVYPEQDIQPRRAA